MVEQSVGGGRDQTTDSFFASDDSDQLFLLFSSSSFGYVRRPTWSAPTRRSYSRQFVGHRHRLRFRGIYFLF